VGNNVQKHAHLDERVTMHVHEEMIDGKKLTEIINETHENVKYLPGHKLPANVVSMLPYRLFLSAAKCSSRPWH
jgi:glycerol-3-phosphate dehydrogenase (NAD+)